MATEGLKKERATALTISVFMLGSFLISFFLQSLLANYFGASSPLDAFTVGNSIPYLFVNWIAYGAVSVILIPVFTEHRFDRNADSIEATNIFITFLFFISLLVSLICIAAASPIISVIGRGFDDETRSIAVKLTRMIMPICPILVICGILSGLLRAYERYNVTPIARCLELLPVIIALLVLGSMIGIFSIPVGMLLGAILSLGVHLYYSSGIGFRYRFSLAINHEKARTMLITFFLFGLLSTSKHLVFLVDRLVASYLAPGSIALYHFATRFQMLIVMILPVAVSIPFFTKLNQHLLARDHDEVKATIHHGLRLVAVPIIPLFTLLVVLRIPMIELWLQHGAFSSADTRTVASVFLYLSPSFLVEAIAPIAFHIYFSMKDTKVLKVLLLIVAAEVAINVVLDLILVRHLGLNGIALATSISKLPTTLLGWIYISWYLGGLRLRSLSPFLLKVTAASIGMVPVVWWVNTILRGALGFTILDRCLRLGILFSLGGSIYIGLAVLFRIREVTELGRLLYGKIRLS